MTDRFVEVIASDVLQRRVAELGEFLGTVIAGIYEGIRLGASNHPSQYQQAAGRAHQSWEDYFQRLQGANG